MMTDSQQVEPRSAESDTSSKPIPRGASKPRAKVLSPQVDKPTLSPEGDSIAFWDPDPAYVTPDPKSLRDSLSNHHTRNEGATMTGQEERGSRTERPRVKQDTTGKRAEQRDSEGNSRA